VTFDAAKHVGVGPASNEKYMVAELRHMRAAIAKYKHAGVEAAYDVHRVPVANFVNTSRVHDARAIFEEVWWWGGEHQCTTAGTTPPLDGQVAGNN